MAFALQPVKGKSPTVQVWARVLGGSVWTRCHADLEGRLLYCVSGGIDARSHIAVWPNNQMGRMDARRTLTLLTQWGYECAVLYPDRDSWWREISNSLSERGAEWMQRQLASPVA